MSIYIFILQITSSELKFHWKCEFPSRFYFIPFVLKKYFTQCISLNICIGPSPAYLYKRGALLYLSVNMIWVPTAVQYRILR